MLLVSSVADFDGHGWAGGGLATGDGPDLLLRLRQLNFSLLHGLSLVRLTLQMSRAPRSPAARLLHLRVRRL